VHRVGVLSFDQTHPSLCRERPRQACTGRGAAQNLAEQQSGWQAQFVRELEGLPIEPVRTHLAADKTPFEPSALYEVAGARRLVDETRRSSRFRALADARLLELARGLLEHAAASDALNDYTLLHNDITHIR
jgi:hypothetical protein